MSLSDFEGAFMNDVSSEEEGGGPPKSRYKGDENRQLVLGKDDVVYEHQKNI